MNIFKLGLCVVAMGGFFVGSDMSQTQSQRTSQSAPPVMEMMAPVRATRMCRLSPAHRLHTWRRPYLPTWTAPGVAWVYR